MKHHGSCHCGRAAFAVEGDLGTVIECNCSHCSRKGLLLWFVPRGQFTLDKGEADLGTYLFNKHVISHRFCRHCGTQPFASGKDPRGNDMVAINVRCLEGIDLAAVERTPYDGASK